MSVTTVTKDQFKAFVAALIGSDQKVVGVLGLVVGREMAKRGRDPDDGKEDESSGEEGT